MSWWELGSNSLILIGCFMFSGHLWCRPYVHWLHCEMAWKCSWCSHPVRVRPVWCVWEQPGKASQRTLSWGQWLYAAWLVVYSILKPKYSQGKSLQLPPEVGMINCRKSHRNPEEKMAQSPWILAAASEGMQGNHSLHDSTQPSHIIEPGSALWLRFRLWQRLRLWQLWFWFGWWQSPCQLSAVTTDTC